MRTGLFASLFLIIIQNNCTIKPKHIMSIDYPVSYFDQNNNKYLITETEVIYEPVSISYSSSGQYQGGTAFTKKLEARTKLKLERIIIEIISDKTIHKTNRDKTTTMLKKGDKLYILKAGEQSKTLEDVLRGIE